MSRTSESVKRWRKLSKNRIIDAMGGKCCCCGYNKCSAALALHHLDPTQKDISLAAIRANPISWSKIVEELRKCVLVCHVCHSEIHYDMRELPKDFPKFDETYADYKSAEKMLRIEEAEKMKTPCKVCNKLKPPSQVTCSPTCGAQHRSKIDWENIDLVAMLKFSHSVVAVAEILGCSDAAVHKRMRKLGLK